MWTCVWEWACLLGSSRMQKYMVCVRWYVCAGMWGRRELFKSCTFCSNMWLDIVKCNASSFTQRSTSSVAHAQLYSCTSNSQISNQDIGYYTVLDAVTAPLLNVCYRLLLVSSRPQLLLSNSQTYTQLRKILHTGSDIAHWEWHSTLGVASGNFSPCGRRT